MRVGLSSKWKPQKGQHNPMRMRCSWNEDMTSQNSPAHAPHNETRNSCSHCADIPVLVPWFINTTAMKGNILCRPLGWQERGIKMHRRCNANSWSHVGEQNTLRIRLQGKKGPPASEMRWYSWAANPGSHQNPWHHQAALQQRGHSLKPWASVKHIPALQLSFWRVPPQSFMLPASQKGR